VVTPDLPTPRALESSIDDAMIVDRGGSALGSRRSGGGIGPRPPRFSAWRRTSRRRSSGVGVDLIGGLNHDSTRTSVIARRKEIACAIRDHQRWLLCGETGSGKTTQLPQICLELGRAWRGRSGTPSRADRGANVAQRIADELGSPLGRQAPWASRCGSATRLRRIHSSS